MAKAKTTTHAAGQADPNTGNVGSGSAGSTTAKERKPVDPENTIHWNGATDAFVAGLLLDHPGQLTTKQIAQALAQQFPNDAKLFLSETAPEKVRQRIKKLDKRAQSMGLGKLELRRSANTGYDAGETLANVFAARGRVATAATVPAQAPVAPVAAPATIPIPMIGGGLVSG